MMFSRKLLFCTFILAIALVFGIASTQSAIAKSIDVNGKLKERLIKQSKFNNIKPKGTKLKKVEFKGEMRSQGMKFKMKQYPTDPMILQESTLYNCNDRESTQHMSVSKTSTDTNSWTNTDCLEVGVEATAKAGIPLIGETEIAVHTDYSHEWSKTKEHSETVRWDQGVDVPVDAEKAVKVQFVVEERKMKNIPYTVDFIAKGKTKAYFSPKVDYGKGEVCLYQHKDYKGRRVCFKIGQHCNNFLRIKFNDQVSSLKISGPVRVELYEHIHYKGFQKIYTKSTPWVGKKYNDKFSSIRIIGKNVPQVQIFQHKDYKGWCQSYMIGEKEKDFVSIGRNDAVSSIKVWGACYAELYQHVNYKGKKTTYKSSKNWVGKNLNDTFSSIKVFPEETVKEFQLEDYLSVKDRTFTIKGKFDGCTAVQGSFRTSKPWPLEGCTQLAAAEGQKSLKAAPPKKKRKAPGKAESILSKALSKKAIKKGEWKELTPDKLLKKAKPLTEKTGTILKTFKPKRRK